MQKSPPISALERWTRVFDPERLPAPLVPLRRLVTDILRTQIFQRAGGMAYTTLFSIVPVLAVTFAIVSAFQPIADPNAQWFDKFRSLVLDNLAPTTGAHLVGQLESFLVNMDVTKIGLTGFAGVLITLVLTLRSVEGALNEIWLVQTERSLFRRFLFFWTLCSLGALVLSLVVGVFSHFELGNLLPFTHGASPPAPVLTAITAITATFAFFALLYKIGPNCQVRVKAAAAGALVATVLIRLASAAFALYATHNHFYDNVYGALAAVPFFLLWLYVSWVVILFGALVAWRVQSGFGVRAEALLTPSSQADPVELERDMQLRGLMPLVCILALNRRFVAGERGGASVGTLAADLDLPLAWVRDGLRAAASLGYLAPVLSGRHDGRRDADAPSPLDGEETADVYVPAADPATVNLRELAGDLTAEARRFLETRRAQLPLAPERLLAVSAGAPDGSGATKVETTLTQLLLPVTAPPP